MNIEQLIPKETTDRDGYIKNILLKELPNQIGVFFSDVVFNFKTDKPITHSVEYIKYKEIELVTLDYGDTWRVVTNNPLHFLPKEYLLEEWEVL